MKTKIFVTGGAGYIGSHICKELIKVGYEVLVFDNLSKGHKWAIPKEAKFIEGDLSDVVLVEKILNDFRPEVIIHLAALIEAGTSMKKPKEFFDNNTINTFNLLNICLKFGIKKLVFSSTAAVYGEPIETPIKEEHPLNPTNYYGWSKLFVEKILESYGLAYDFKYVVLRYFNAAGASLDGSLGQAYEPRTHLIGKLMETVSGKKNEFKIFGTDYKTKDGTCIRDYVHVVDIAKAHLLALDFIEKNNKSDIFNLGSGRTYSVKEMVNATKEITGLDFKIIEVGRREGDPGALEADYSKAKQVLGWEPLNSDINTIITTAWKWENKKIKK